jgi:hypothetical protein
MWPFKKKGSTLQPGESAELNFEIPLDEEIGEIILKYDDKFGNKYETRALVNFKEKKIINQNSRMVKKVKDIPEEDSPKLVIDEEALESYFKKAR